jgi:hypothetical protein
MMKGVMKIDPEELFMAYSWQRIKAVGTQRLGNKIEDNNRRNNAITIWIITGISLFIILMLIWR